METDIDLCIPVSAIFDEFVCPICLEAITDCYITPCGHNGCNECLSEWISRQHSCPVCVAPNITIPKLVKNLSFDNIYLKICDERRKAAAKYFKNLATTNAADSVTTLTPIEAVFQKHMHASLAGYKSVLAELDAKFQRRREHVLAEFTSRVDGIRAAHKLALRLGSREAELAELPAAPPSMARTTSLEDSERIVSEATIVRDAQLAEIQKQHDDAVALIVSEYDAFLATALPPVSLLPAVVTVSVPSRGWRFQLKVRPSDFVRDLEEAVTQQVLAAFGDTVQSFDGTWSLADVISADGAGGAGAILLSPATTLYVSCPGGRLLAGSDIVFGGTVALKSEVVGVCFAKEFIAGAGQTMDYFSCEQCGCSWICSACAKHCHKTHTIKPYVQGHRPSYGCCYCSKKKLCTLPGAAKK